MLACIACSKHQLDDGADDTARAGTPSTKDAVKSLTSQIKDMVLKFSGTSRQCKGGGPYRHRSHHHHHHQQSSRRGGGSYLNPRHDDDYLDAGSEYLRAASASSTPAWDLSSIKVDQQGKWVPAGEEGDDHALIEEDDGAPKEWMAQVEPGVHITFVSLPGGAGNDLKRIRFSREMFNKWQAQRWWGENYDRIMELYNVQRFSRQALPTPPRSDDGGEQQRESFYSRVGSTRESPATPPPMGKQRNTYNININNNFRPPSTSAAAAASSSRGGGGGYEFPSVPDPSEHILPHHHLFHPQQGGGGGGGTNGMVKMGDQCCSVSMDAASRTTTSSRDEAVSVSNASDMEVTEWVEQDEPGVYITIRELPDGTRELRRVRFSRERFGEVHAKLWWEDNRERIQAQYL